VIHDVANIELARHKTKNKTTTTTNQKYKTSKYKHTNKGKTRRRGEGWILKREVKESIDSRTHTSRAKAIGKGSRAATIKAISCE